jgi:DNA primase
LKAFRGRVSPELLKKIKDSVNLIEVVGEHVVLRKVGANHSGLCPFHSERTPSFSVSEQKQVFHCYGCKKSGDLLSFVMELHGLSFPEAIEELAERARIALPADWKGTGGEADPEAAKLQEAARERLRVAFKLNRFTAAFYHGSLPRLAKAADYFRSRGVGQEAVRSFYLGAAPQAWDSLARHLAAAKAPLPLAVELGLVRPSKAGAQRGGGPEASSPGYFDLFRNRVIFPILDLRGRVAGFGGRDLGGDSAGEASLGGTGSPGASSGGALGAVRDGGAKEAPKYLNSSDSFVFQKGKLAYGLFQAQRHIRERDEVILVEGYFDVLALHAAGFANAVAICGTSLTADHLAAFRRLGKKVTLLLDGDKAGIAATDRAMVTGLEEGLVLYGATMPAGLDPDELLFDQVTGAPRPEGVERLGQILRDAGPLLDSRIEAAARESARGAEERSRAVKQVGAWLARFRDPVGKAVRLEEAAGKLGVSRALLEQAGGPGQGRAASPSRASLPSSLGPSSSGQSSSGPSSFGRAGRPAAAGVATTTRKEGRTGARAEPRAEQLKSRDRVLLTAFARGGSYSEMLFRALKDLPVKVTVAELFDAAVVRDWVARLVAEPGAYERFRAMPEAVLEVGGHNGPGPGRIDQEGQGQSLWPGGMDPRVRSVVAEALIAPQCPYEDSEVRLAIDRGIQRALERFSQQIMVAIGQAQANKDAELESRLMKDYLDVKRKIKEFNSFYDEA